MTKRFCVLTANRSKDARMIALAIAYDAKGMAEEGGENKGAIVRAVMAGREGEQWEWCAGFVTQCYIDAFRFMHISDPFWNCANRFSSSALYKWASTYDKLTTDPRNGDLLLVRGGATGHKHTAMVAKAERPTVITIEGNLDDAVRMGERHRDTLDFVKVC